MNTNRSRQVVSKRDVAKIKTKSASYIPRTDKRRRDCLTLKRKIAVLEDAEARSEMELIEPLKDFAAQDYKEKPKTPTQTAYGTTRKKGRGTRHLRKSIRRKTTPQEKQKEPTTKGETNQLRIVFILVC